MKNLYKLFLIPFIFSLAIFSSCDDMSRGSRIKDIIALKEIKKVALISFSINSDCTIGTGEDTEYIGDQQEIKKFGKFHLTHLLNLVKPRNSPSFLDFKEMIESKNYKSFVFNTSYSTNKIVKSFPEWVPFRDYYINPFESIGIIKINSDNSKAFCKSLSTDAVISMEVKYALDHSFNIPILGNFIKPNWTSSCEINSQVFNSKGELVWHYKFNVDSPIKEKSNKSLNLIVFTNTSISGKQTNNLIESVVKFSSQKIIDTLYSDINE